MTAESHTTPELDADAMSAFGSSGLGKGLERFRLPRADRLRAGRAVVLTVLVAWLPLPILSLIEGVAWSTQLQVPFFKDFLPYGQLLVSMPVLLFGEFVVGKRLGLAIMELKQSDVLAPEDTPALETVLARAQALWHGRAVNAVIILVALLLLVVSLWGAREWLTGGWQLEGGRLTLPGWWYALVSLTVLRFLIARWLWRLALWAWVLWKTSRLKLQPLPTHPDRAGGLAFLGGTQAAFAGLVFALGVQLACLCADAVVFRGADLMGFKGEAAAFVVVVLIVMLLPLVVFVPKLVRARDEYLVFLSGRGYRGAAYLERRLRESEDGKLPTEDVSGLTDFGPLYENARLMRPVPLEVRHVGVLALAAVAPFLPLVFLVMPAQVVFKTLAKLIM